jgi:hypothetical protein
MVIHVVKPSGKQRLLQLRRQLFEVVLTSFCISGALLLFNFLNYNSFRPKIPENTQFMGTISSHDIPQTLERIHISISFHYNVERLQILYENLETINLWETTADVCIGTNAPEKLLVFLQSSALATAYNDKERGSRFLRELAMKESGFPIMATFA